MAKYNQLTGLIKRKANKRKGRGIAAGQGKTAGRGTKGQKSRSGGSVRPYFEGGQTPLIRKLPKLPGFRSVRPPALTVYSGQLDELKTSSKIIDNHTLHQAGLISDGYSRVKGSIEKAHRVRLQAVSAAAKADLEKAGGSFETAPRPQRPSSIKKGERKTARQKAEAKRDKKPPAVADKSRKVVK